MGLIFFLNYLLSVNFKTTRRHKRRHFKQTKMTHCNRGTRNHKCKHGHHISRGNKYKMKGG